MFYRPVHAAELVIFDSLVLITLRFLGRGIFFFRAKEKCAHIGFSPEAKPWECRVGAKWKVLFWKIDLGFTHGLCKCQEA